MTNFPPQEVLQSVDSGETYPIEWWWNNYVLTGNPDGTYTATTKFSNGIPPMTLRRIEAGPPFLGLEYNVLLRSEADGQIKVGCADGNSKSYNPDVEVHDIDQCGTCLPGYTRNSDTHCWKVGWRLVDCKTGAIYYAPQGLQQINGLHPHGEDPWTYYAGKESFGTTHLGRDVVNTKKNWKKSRGVADKSNYIKSVRPHLSIRPRAGSPINITTTGYWAYRARQIIAIRNDGTALVSSGEGTSTGWPGKDYGLTVKDLKNKGCDANWVALSDDDRAKVPGFLGEGGGLGATKVILLDDVEDDETETPVTDPLQGGPTQPVEPEKTNWLLYGGLAAAVIGLPLLFGRGN